MHHTTWLMFVLSCLTRFVLVFGKIREADQCYFFCCACVLFVPTCGGCVTQEPFQPNWVLGTRIAQEKEVSNKTSFSNRRSKRNIARDVRKYGASGDSSDHWGKNNEVSFKSSKDDLLVNSAEDRVGHNETRHTRLCRRRTCPTWRQLNYSSVVVRRSPKKNSSWRVRHCCGVLKCFKCQSS